MLLLLGLALLLAGQRGVAAGVIVALGAGLAARAALQAYRDRAAPEALDRGGFDAGDPLPAHARGREVDRTRTIELGGADRRAGGAIGGRGQHRSGAGWGAGDGGGTAG